MSWSLSLPVRIEFGAGRVPEELGCLIKGEGLPGGLLINDLTFIKNGLADQVVEASKGRITDMFSDLVPNPTVESVDTYSGLVRERGYEFLVCLGGGSSLDYGKTVGGLCKTRDSIRGCMHEKGISGPGHLSLIATSTTVGTGNEVTMMAVISDEENNKRILAGTPNFYPDLTILDPRLTLSLPPSVTASHGTDVLSQTPEGYWSRNHQPVCDTCVVRACSLALGCLKRAYKDENDPEARTAMCEASLLAGIAFATPKTNGPHVCSCPLISIYHVPHGEACDITLDNSLRLNKDAQGGCPHQPTKMIGEQDIYELVDDILTLKQRAELRCRLSEARILESNIPSLVKGCHHPSTAPSPVEVTDEILDAMFRRFL